MDATIYTCGHNRNLDLTALRIHCKAQQFQIVGEFDDKTNARDLKQREGLIEAVLNCDRGSILLVWSFAGLFPSMSLCAWLECLLDDRGVAIVDIYDAGIRSENKHVIRVLKQHNWLKRFRLEVKRVKRCIKLAENDELTTHCLPYGVELSQEGKAVKNYEEIALIDTIKQQWKKYKSLYSVEKWLNATGLTNRSGKPWHRQQIKRILQKEGLI